jgi:hypothetical protein
MIDARPTGRAKKESKMRSTIVSGVLALGLLGTTASAAVVIGNYPPANDGTQSAGLNLTRRKALSFTMPAGDAYNITSVTLRLGNYLTPDDNVLLEIRDHTGVTTAPGAAVLGTFTAPGSGSTAVGDFVFTPNGTVTLQAATSYWIYVYGDVGAFDWKASNPGITPTGIATYGGSSLFTSNSGTTWSNSSGLNTFQIDGELVPAPGALAIMGLGLLGTARRRR